jgi:hypothetical protein
VDWWRRRELRGEVLDEVELAADSDRSPGVLLASGYIAGGALAGIIIAFMAGSLGNIDAALTNWATARNPFFAGPYSDWLALLPFAALCGYLFLVARGWLLRSIDVSSGRR